MSLNSMSALEAALVQEFGDVLNTEDSPISDSESEDESTMV
jgi:hypothetical protein